ncbi:MAG: GldG family protein [Clostridia bacterium]|nr:GldG family protein [Clostridia bacterium]
MQKNKRFGAVSVLTALFTVAIIIATIFVVELLCERYPLKADISKNKIYSISEYTENVLEKLDKDVNVYAIYSSGTESDFVVEVLHRYQRASDKVNVQIVGEKDMPELSVKYDPYNNGLQNGSIIFACGDNYRIVNENELTDYNVYTGVETEFYAEERFTQAILQVTNDELKTVYRVAGHGEDDGGLDGIFKNYGYEQKDINLATEDIPEDCTVLMIRNLQTDISTDEMVKIDQYLVNGGSVLVLLDPSSFETNALYGYLDSYWDIQISDDIVFDADASRTDGQVFYATGAGHEIAKNILDVNDANGYVVCMMSKAISLRNGGRASAIMTTTEKGFKLPFGAGQGSEVEAPYAPIAATAQTGFEFEKDGEMKQTTAKIAVFGSSHIFQNDLFSDPKFLNKDLFLNTMQWLHEEEINTGIRPKNLESDTITLTERQQTQIMWIIIVYPLLILAYGIYMWFRRVHK